LKAVELKSVEFNDELTKIITCCEEIQTLLRGMKSTIKHKED